MSPSEFDLRAALHDGEGDGPDVDRVVAAGQARRGQRRTRLLTAAAAVVVVAGVATGAAALLDDSGSPKAQSGPAASAAAGGGQAAPDLAESSTSADRAAAPRAGRAAADTAVACPTSFPKTLLPGGGSPGQFGSDGPLFAEPVTSMVVCTYRTDSSGTHGRFVLTGTDATALARSLENASTRQILRRCPPTAPGTEREVAFVGVTARGAALRTVTASYPSCGARVTNGTAIRYDWQPPSALTRQLDALVPSTVPKPSIRPSGKNIGTPIHN